jgi:class 3 adenylate cyclase
MEDLDPEEAHAVVDPVLRIMVEAVHRYEGYVVRTTGDGIFALFGAPVAHEDHPQRALAAALRLQQELHAHGQGRIAHGLHPLEARVGVHTGEVVAHTVETDGKVEYRLVGHTANLAARMEMVAPTGSIAASEYTRKLCEGYFTFKPLGPMTVKGISEPVAVYEVTGFGPLRTRLQRAVARGLTKFVGREREIEALRHAAMLAREGRGQIVAAMADPGVGKSRLFYEFKATNASGWMMLEALSVSHGKASAYVPVIDLLRDYFEIAVTDDERKRREKVAGKIAILDRSLEDTLPYLFSLLGIVNGDDPLAQMDARVKKRLTLETIKRILLRESLNQPLMAVFEDLHWMDGESEALLNLLADSIGTSRILLLVNYRPEYSHKWGSKSYYTQLRLDPLGKENADEMLSTLLGSDATLVSLKRVIAEKTEGNPLFIEEICLSLFEDGTLACNGGVKLAKPLASLRIPPTVQGIIASRIDRLPADEKDLLQTVAVIGTEFNLGVARSVSAKSDDDLNRMLNYLQLAEFLYEQPSTGDVEYTFKHALTHDVTYNSLLSDRRKLLHERTGQAIEALYSQRLEDHYANLAHHYRSSNNAAKAVEYLRLAGEQAVDRGAYAQGGANAELAIKLMERLPEGVTRLRAELGLRLMETMTVTALYGMASAERVQISERVCQLSESLGEVSTLFRGLLILGFAHSHRFEARRALEIARRCVKLAEQDLNEMLPAANALLGQALHRSGDLLGASSAVRLAMKDLVSPRQPAARLTSSNTWAVQPMTLVYVEQALGRPDEARKFAEEALRRARELKHSLTLGGALQTACLLRYQLREPEAARGLAETLIALAEEQGFREFLITGKALRAWAMTELDQTKAAVTELEALAASSQRFVLISKSMLLAKAYVRVRRPEEALTIVDAELARIRESGAYQEAAELHQLKGEAILMRDSSAANETETCFRKAIEIAKDQSAKWWELRATVSLARLLARTGRPDEARAMLAEIYNWFTEGFDTADLRDAKALLDELSA